MKRFFCLLIMVCLAFGVGSVGEEVDLNIDTFTESAIEAALWSENAYAFKDKTEDPDSKHILEEVGGTLQDVSYLILTAMEDANLLKSRIGDIEPEDITSYMLDESYYIETAYLSIMDSIIQVSVYGKESFYSAVIDYYDSEGNLWVTKTVDAAERTNGDMLFYLNIYDGGNYLSNRSIVLCDEEGEKTLFTRSFGNINRTIINVELWQTGVDYEWGEWLLYSAE